jgi:hypothetical protein
MSFFKKISHSPFIIRLLHWEYWPFNVVYAFIIPYWFYLGARARSFFFFGAANPSIENSGFLMESKKKIYDIMPRSLYPPTLFFKAGTCEDELLAAVRNSGFRFPLIGKPDIGGQGRGVKKLTIEAQLLEYGRSSHLDFLVQEFVPFEQEVGIFYYRYPGTEQGVISGIVGKEFLQVKGDGIATIETLLMQDKRFILQMPVLKATYGKDLQKVLPKDESFILVPYGNHARGAKFVDDSHLADEALTRVIDDVCKQISGFYYGRLDIRFDNWDSFRQGKDFSIIELNGAGSEPTHMYDPRHSIFFAWKEITRHWKILWRISRINHQNGIPFMTVKEGRKMFRDNAVHEKLMSKYA